MLRVPAALRTEHDRLHTRLARATQAPGRTGEAARTVARILDPHFRREDEYAMPPLGLLARLTRGAVTADMVEALPLAARVKEELPLMLAEHRAIEGALLALARVAREEGQTEWAELAEDLRLHAQLEEEVLYPAAVLVAAYVRTQLHPEGVS